MFKGRQKLLTSFAPEDIINDDSNVAVMINSVISQHLANKSQIDTLTAYYNGNQPILNKVKKVRPEINNKLVLNNSQRITRTVVGYFLGTPIQFIQSKTDKQVEIDDLNDMLSYEDKSATDKEIGDYQSICGTAFRLIYTDSIEDADEVPFEEKALDPAFTFVVYENSIAEKPVAGVTYKVNLDEKGEIENYTYYVYTVGGMYKIVTDSDQSIDENATFNFMTYYVGGIPLIEYPNNMWRTGDWELVIDLMNSINTLYSGRMDDIDQVIQSLLVFVNADLDSELYAEMRESGAVMLKNKTGAKSEVKVIQNALDQSGMNLLAKELENMLDTLVGIPSRDNRSGGGGDTGQAVELRDGWADLEIVARNKELVFKRSEKRALKIILYILRNKKESTLTLKDVDIKFSRNKNHNLLVKSQSYSTLLATETLTPNDCLTIVDLVSDTNEYASRGESYWEDKGENAEPKEVVEPVVEPLNQTP